MIDFKSKNFLFCLLLAFILLLSSFSGLGGSVTINEELSIDKTPFYSMNKMNNLELFSDLNQGNSKVSILTEIIGNMPIADDQIYNETYPSMVSYDEFLLCGYEIGIDNDTYVYYKISEDYGQTWSDPYYNISGKYENYSSPSLCIIPNSDNAYSTFTSAYNSSGALFFASFPDFSESMSDVEVIPIDWSDNGFYNFTKPQMIAYPDGNLPWVIGVTGSTDYKDETTGEGPCVNTPMFMFNTPGTSGFYTIFWDPTINNTYNLSIDIEYDSSDTIFGACEITNNSTQDLLFFYGNPNDWSSSDNIPLYNQTLTNDKNLTHPDIAVNDTQLFIVAESEFNGSREIILFNSSNNGDNWTVQNLTSEILPPGLNPEHPNLFANETNISCTFIESDNLFLTYFDNITGNWSTPVQINQQPGSVVSEHRFTEMKDPGHIVWTDIRNGTRDIYLDVGDIPTFDLAVIDFEIIRDKNKPLFLFTRNQIKVTVENVGEEIGKNVRFDVLFDRDDETDISTGYHGIVNYIEPGVEVEVTRPLFQYKSSEFFTAAKEFAGIESITIHLDPREETNDNNRDNNIYTEDVQYSDIFFFLAFIEIFLMPLN